MLGGALVYGGAEEKLFDCLREVAVAVIAPSLSAMHAQRDYYAYDAVLELLEALLALDHSRGWALMSRPMFTYAA